MSSLALTDLQAKLRELEERRAANARADGDHHYSSDRSDADSAPYHAEKAGERETPTWGRLQLQAAARWLTPSQASAALLAVRDSRMRVSFEPPFRPLSGSLYAVDEVATPQWREDGFTYEAPPPHARGRDRVHPLHGTLLLRVSEHATEGAPHMLRRAYCVEDAAQPHRPGLWLVQYMHAALPGARPALEVSPWGAPAPAHSEGQGSATDPFGAQSQARAGAGEATGVATPPRGAYEDSEGGSAVVGRRGDDTGASLHPGAAALAVEAGMAARERARQALPLAWQEDVGADSETSEEEGEEEEEGAFSVPADTAPSAGAGGWGGSREGRGEGSVRTDGTGHVASFEDWAQSMSAASEGFAPAPERVASPPPDTSPREAPPRGEGAHGWATTSSTSDSEGSGLGSALFPATVSTSSVRAQASVGGNGMAAGPRGRFGPRERADTGMHRAPAAAVPALRGPTRAQHARAHATATAPTPAAARARVKGSAGAQASSSSLSSVLLSTFRARGATQGTRGQPPVRTRAARASAAATRGVRRGAAARREPRASDGERPRGRERERGGTTLPSRAPASRSSMPPPGANGAALLARTAGDAAPSRGARSLSVDRAGDRGQHPLTADDAFEQGVSYDDFMRGFVGGTDAHGTDATQPAPTPTPAFAPAPTPAPAPAPAEDAEDPSSALEQQRIEAQAYRRAAAERAAERRRAKLAREREASAKLQADAARLEAARARRVVAADTLHRFARGFLCRHRLHALSRSRAALARVVRQWRARRARRRILRGIARLQSCPRRRGARAELERRRRAREVLHALVSRWYLRYSAARRTRAAVTLQAAARRWRAQWELARRRAWVAQLQGQTTALAQPPPPSLQAQRSPGSGGVPQAALRTPHQPVLGSPPLSTGRSRGSAASYRSPSFSHSALPSPENAAAWAVAAAAAAQSPAPPRAVRANAKPREGDRRSPRPSTSPSGVYGVFFAKRARVQALVLGYAVRRLMRGHRAHTLRGQIRDTEDLLAAEQRQSGRSAFAHSLQVQLRRQKADLTDLLCPAHGTALSSLARQLQAARRAEERRMAHAPPLSSPRRRRGSPGSAAQGAGPAAGRTLAEISQQRAANLRGARQRARQFGAMSRSGARAPPPSRQGNGRTRSDAVASAPSPGEPASDADDSDATETAGAAGATEAVEEGGAGVEGAPSEHTAAPVTDPARITVRRVAATGLRVPAPGPGGSAPQVVAAVWVEAGNGKAGRERLLPVIENDGRPCWDEVDLAAPLPPRDPLSAVLRVEFRDADRFSDHPLLGSAAVPARRVHSGPGSAVEASVPLQAGAVKTHRVAGSALVYACLRGPSEEQLAARARRQGPVSAPPPSTRRAAPVVEAAGSSTDENGADESPGQRHEPAPAPALSPGRAGRLEALRRRTRYDPRSATGGAGGTAAAGKPDWSQVQARTDCHIAPAVRERQTCRCDRATLTLLLAPSLSRSPCQRQPARRRPRPSRVVHRKLNFAHVASRVDSRLVRTRGPTASTRRREQSPPARRGPLPPKEDVAPLQRAVQLSEDEERDVEGAGEPTLYRPGKTLLLGRGRLRRNEGRRATIRRLPTDQVEALRASVGTERGGSSGEDAAYDSDEEGGSVTAVAAVDLSGDSPRGLGLGPTGHPRLYHAGGDAVRFGFRGGAAGRGALASVSVAQAAAPTGLPLPTRMPRIDYGDEDEEGDEERTDETEQEPEEVSDGGDVGAPVGSSGGSSAPSVVRRAAAAAAAGVDASGSSTENAELAQEQALQHRHHEEEIGALEARARQVAAHAAHALRAGDGEDSDTQSGVVEVVPEGAFQPDPASGIPQLARGSRFFANVDLASYATQVELYRAEYAAFLSAPPEVEGGE